MCGRCWEKSPVVRVTDVSGEKDMDAKFMDPPVERRECRRVGGADISAARMVIVVGGICCAGWIRIGRIDSSDWHVIGTRVAHLSHV